MNEYENSCNNNHGCTSMELIGAGNTAANGILALGGKLTLSKWERETCKYCYWATAVFDLAYPY